MKEYIKKFETANAADQYEINDIPFITSIATNPIQNLTCNEEGKQLVNDNGIVTISDVVHGITFTIIEQQTKIHIGLIDDEIENEITIPSEMSISDFIDSEYNENNHYEHSHDIIIQRIVCGRLAWSDELADVYDEPNEVSEDTIIHDGDILYYFNCDYCLLGDTEVTMADGSTKQIKDLVLGDEVLSLDLTTGEQVSRKVIFTDADKNKSASVWDEWEFSDGTIVKTTHRHEFYNVEAGKFKYLDEWKLGEHTYKIDGTTPELIKHTVHEEVVNHYKITLEGSNNFFANGLLTGDRYCNNMEIKLK